VEEPAGSRPLDTSPSSAVPAEPTHPPAGDLDLLVRRAADREAQAWNEVTDRFTRLVRAVARFHRLGDVDAADVVQNTWLRLVENLSRIERPQALPKWLTTTAGLEALTIIRERQLLLRS
jgi:DNA-directed RNA polymerase specialized sigma24 family protein